MRLQFWMEYEEVLHQCAALNKEQLKFLPATTPSTNPGLKDSFHGAIRSFEKLLPNVRATCRRRSVQPGVKAGSSMYCPYRQTAIWSLGMVVGLSTRLRYIGKPGPTLCERVRVGTGSGH